MFCMGFAHLISHSCLVLLLRFLGLEFCSVEIWLCLALNSYSKLTFPQILLPLSGGGRWDLDLIAVKEAQVLDASNTDNIANLMIS